MKSVRVPMINQSVCGMQDKAKGRFIPVIKMSYIFLDSLLMRYNSLSVEQTFISFAFHGLSHATISTIPLQLFLFHWTTQESLGNITLVFRWRDYLWLEGNEGIAYLLCLWCKWLNQIGTEKLLAVLVQQLTFNITCSLCKTN